MRYQVPANTGPGSAETGWLQWNVTTQVQQIYADSNNGFRQRDSGDEPTSQRQVFSS